LGSGNRFGTFWFQTGSHARLPGHPDHLPARSFALRFLKKTYMPKQLRQPITNAPVARRPEAAKDAIKNVFDLKPDEKTDRVHRNGCTLILK
jgi:hypothetical protein